MLNADLNFYHVAFVFFSSLFSYNFVQLIGPAHERTNRATWFKQNNPILKLIIIISLAISALLSMKLEISQLLWLGHLFLFVLFYEKGLNKHFNFRSIPYFKPFIISWVWMGATSVLPFFTSTQELNQKVILLFLETFFLIFSLTILFDLRDLDIDKKLGLKTFSTSLNLKLTKAISILTFLISLGIQTYLLQGTDYLLHFFFIQIVCFIFCIFKTRPNASEVYFLGAVDAMIILNSWPILFV